jgi:hypothetical protein
METLTIQFLVNSIDLPKINEIVNDINLTYGLQVLLTYFANEQKTESFLILVSYSHRNDKNDLGLSIYRFGYQMALNNKQLH